MDASVEARETMEWEAYLKGDLDFCMSIHVYYLSYVESQTTDDNTFDRLSANGEAIVGTNVCSSPANAVAQ